MGDRTGRARIRRRRALAGVLALGLVALVVVLLLRGGDERPVVGSTLEVTVRDRTGSGALSTAPGVPLSDRTDLLPAGGPGSAAGRGAADDGPDGDGARSEDDGADADDGRAADDGPAEDGGGDDGAAADDGATGDAPAPRPGRVLATVAQLTDTHVRDTASPARVPFLDRLGTPFTPIFRPQEPLTLQTLAAATRTVNALAPQLTIVTGDLADNAQQNELDAAIAVLEGGEVRPFDARSLQGPDNADPFYYRPDVDPPREPGLLDRARRPFVAPGLDGPVAALPGNHDVLVGGEVQATPALREVAVGDRRLVTPDPEFARTIPREADAAQEAADRLLGAGRLPGTTAAVRPDPTRRLLTGAEAVRRLAAAGLAGDRDGRADQVRDVGDRVRVVLLDDVPRGGQDRGAAEPAQLAFLDRALATAGDRWVLVAFHDPLERTARGRAIRDRLARAPRVLATIGGDTHHDLVQPVRTAAGGHWSLTTSALADWPQQGRALRVRETADGGAVLETWKLDTAPDPLGDVARRLAHLDAQGGRPGGNAGAAADRNVRLYKPPPR